MCPLIRRVFCLHSETVEKQHLLLSLHQSLQRIPFLQIWEVRRMVATITTAPHLITPTRWVGGQSSNCQMVTWLISLTDAQGNIWRYDPSYKCNTFRKFAFHFKFDWKRHIFRAYRAEDKRWKKEPYRFVFWIKKQKSLRSDHLNKESLRIRIKDRY